MGYFLFTYRPPFYQICFFTLPGNYPDTGGRNRHASNDVQPPNDCAVFPDCKIGSIHPTFPPVPKHYHDPYGFVLYCLPKPFHRLNCFSPNTTVHTNDWTLPLHRKRTIILFFRYLTIGNLLSVNLPIDALAIDADHQHCYSRSCGVLSWNRSENVIDLFISRSSSQMN